MGFSVVDSYGYPLTLWRKSRGVSFTAAAPPTLSVIVPKWVQQVLFK